MEWFKAWICGISTAAIIISVAKSLAAKNNAGRYIGVIGAVIMVFALLAPFKRIRISDIPEYSARYDYESRALAENLKSSNQRMKTDIIENELSAYIMKRADEMSVECIDARVDARMTQTEEIYIQTVEIVFSQQADESKKREFTKLVQQEMAAQSVVQREDAGK